MGLKLTQVNERHATGLLDGMSFSMEVLRDKAVASIGDAKKWRSVQKLDEYQAGKPMSPAGMNHLIYGFIAKYRNETKPVYA